jgi:hypothetical protein
VAATGLLLAMQKSHNPTTMAAPLTLRLEWSERERESGNFIDLFKDSNGSGGDAVKEEDYGIFYRYHRR